ncbi:hypothetical protein H4R34_003598, partial [Dimargaris verticillata]
MANHPGSRPDDASGADPSTSSTNNPPAYFIPELHEGNAGLMGLDFQFHQSFLDRPDVGSYSDIVSALCQNPGFNPASLELGFDNVAALANSLSTSTATTAFNNFGLSDATFLAAAASSTLTPPTVSGVPAAANFNFLLTPTTPGFSSTISGNDLTLSPPSDGMGLFTLGPSPTSTTKNGAQPNASLSPPSFTTAGPSPTPFAQSLEGLHMLHPTDTLDPVLLNDILRSPVLESLLPASTSMPTSTSAQPTPTGHASLTPTSGTKRARPEPRNSAPKAPKRAKASKPNKSAVQPLAKRPRKRQVPPSPPLSPPEGSSPVSISLSPTPIKPQPDQTAQQLWQLKPLSPAASRPLNRPVSIASALDAPSLSANKVPINRLGSVGSTLTATPAILPAAPDPAAANGPPPLSTPPVKSYRRIAHNAIERRYRNNINDRIRELKDSIPALAHLQAERDDEKQSRRGGSAGSLGGTKAKLDSPLPKEVDGIAPASKLNKATILRKATEYVWHLRRTNDSLRRKQEAYIGLIRDQAPHLLPLLESMDQQAQREADELMTLLRSQPAMGMENGPAAERSVDPLGNTPAELPAATMPLGPARTVVGTHAPESESMEALPSVATSSDSDTSSAGPHDATAPGATVSPNRSGASSGSSYPLRAMLGVSLCISMASSPFASSSSGGGEDGGYEQRTLSSIPFLRGWHGSATANSLGQWGHAITSSDLFHWARLFIFVSSLLGLIFFDDWFGDRRQAKKRRYWKTQYGTHATPTEVNTMEASANHTGALTSDSPQTATATSPTSPGTHGRRDRQRVQVTRTKVGARHATLLTSVAEINNTPLPRSYRSMFMRICGEVVRL